MKTTQVQPYLFFGGRCEEALESYRTALGAQVDMIMRYNESPEPTPPGMLALALRGKSCAPAFVALAEEGQVRMPMTKTFWSPRFGMVADRFGMGWMVTVQP